jgi:hypothetical protein
VDLLALDTCFGASLEAAYELRTVARRLTAAPGLIYSPGLDWAGALARAGGTGTDAADLPRTLVRLGMTGRVDRQSALIALDLDKVADAASGLAEMATGLRSDLARTAPAVAVVRSRCQTWGSRGELCDLGQLAAGLAANAPSEGLRQAATRTAQAVATATLARWMSAGGDEAVRPVTALGVYFPATLERLPEGYARGLALGAGTGWTGFLTDYWAWAERLLVGPAP